MKCKFSCIGERQLHVCATIYEDTVYYEDTDRRNLKDKEC